MPDLPTPYLLGCIGVAVACLLGVLHCMASICREQIAVDGLRRRVEGLRREYRKRMQQKNGPMGTVHPFGPEY